MPVVAHCELRLAHDSRELPKRLRSNSPPDRRRRHHSHTAQFSLSFDLLRIKEATAE